MDLLILKYTYIYMYVCMYVCVCMCVWWKCEFEWYLCEWVGGIWMHLFQLLINILHAEKLSL